MSFQKHVKTFVRCVLVKKVTDIRDPLSIVSSLTSCARAEISPITMALEENPFMATNLRTRISL